MPLAYQPSPVEGEGGSKLKKDQMTQQYYSNWNRNRRPSLKKVLQSLSRYPAYLISKLKNEKNLRRKILRGVMYLAASFLLVISLTFAAISLTLPDPNKLNARIIPQSTKIYARDGTTLLYEMIFEIK